jgi:hypothetical protein
MSSAVWIAKPDLSFQVTAHHPSVQFVASTTLPAGMSTTTSFVVAGPDRRFTFESTYAGAAAADAADRRGRWYRAETSKPSWLFSRDVERVLFERLSGMLSVLPSA